METAYLTRHRGGRWALVATGTTRPLATVAQLTEADAQAWAEAEAVNRGLTLVAKSKAGRKPGVCCPTCGAVRPGGA